MSESRLTLKHPTGFFAAGGEMRHALALLSDGGFKLYVYASIRADTCSSVNNTRSIPGGVVVTAPPQHRTPS